MIFITGGNSQGKRAFAMDAFGLSLSDIADGASCPIDEAFEARALNRLHLLIERMLREGIDPMAAALAGAERNPGIVVICDEVGCGIVPADPWQREARELTGRIACALAGRARRVYRVALGIAVCIKEEKQCSQCI
ncbi:MAG: bifunctional adenosylcobinamide kinase/adenosylcobinamide-phosphate guanylyltransferase [Bacillota bacterium]